MWGLCVTVLEDFVHTPREKVIYEMVPPRSFYSVLHAFISTLCMWW